MIAVPYVHDMLRPETVAAVQEQWRDPIFFELDPDDPYAYTDLLRRLWHYPGDLVVVEQDIVPPEGALGALHLCRSMWCTYPYDLGGKVLTDGLGVARFNPLLRLTHPDLADLALAPSDGRVWTRLGLTNLDPESNQATLDRHGRRACLRPDVNLPLGVTGRSRYPSTVGWALCDTYLASQLRALGHEPHVHQPAAQHLHRY